MFRRDVASETAIATIHSPHIGEVRCARAREGNPKTARGIPMIPAIVGIKEPNRSNTANDTRYRRSAGGDRDDLAIHCDMHYTLARIIRSVTPKARQSARSFRVRSSGTMRIYLRGWSGAFSRGAPSGGARELPRRESQDGREGEREIPALSLSRR